jgi:nucleotide-binding universal stress UspA family protein
MDSEAGKPWRILVGVDGSDCSIHAATQAGKLAHRLGAELDLVYVVQQPWFPPGEGAAFQVDAEGASGEFARKMLEEVRHRLADRAPVTRLRVLQGSPAEVLAEEAEAADVKIVVVGTRGRNALARVVVGSVSDRVVHISPKPVLVVR